MTLEEFVKSILDKLGIPHTTGGRYNKSIVDLICLGYRKTDWSPKGASNITKRYFPDKPKNITILNYLTDAEDHKYCNSCKRVLDKNNFSKNKTKRSGLATYCKSCQYKLELPRQRFHASMRRAAIVVATPAWVSEEELKNFYINCPPGYEVDHIIPLKGERVCGLHVLNNLQYLTAEENRVKGNKYYGP